MTDSPGLGATDGAAANAAAEGGAAAGLCAFHKCDAKAIRARGGQSAELQAVLARARSHCRFAPPLIHSTPESLRHSVPPFPKRHCDRTLGAGRRQLRRDRVERAVGRAGALASAAACCTWFRCGCRSWRLTVPPWNKGRLYVIYGDYYRDL